MKDKIFGVLQRVGRSFMLPIALLPVAGILLGLGSVFTNETTLSTYHLTAVFGEGTFMYGLNQIFNAVGSAVGGKFGKKLGGNLGASLARNIVGLLKK